jgi:hypothetical protein
MNDNTVSELDEVVEGLGHTWRELITSSALQAYAHDMTRGTFYFEDGSDDSFGFNSVSAGDRPEVEIDECRETVTLRNKEGERTVFQYELDESQSLSEDVVLLYRYMRIFQKRMFNAYRNEWITLGDFEHYNIDGPNEQDVTEDFVW